MISRLDVSGIATCDITQERPAQERPSVYDSRPNLESCPSLETQQLCFQNDLLARSLLKLEQEPPSFKKGQDALKLLNLFPREALPHETMPEAIARHQKDQEVLLCYLINTLILPLCLEGFIPLSELTNYPNYKNWICDSFLNPQVRLIDPKLEDLIKSGLAKALKHNEIPFKDYREEDIMNILLTHLVQHYALSDLRFLDTHCSDLGYRPLLARFVRGFLEAIKSSDIESFHKKTEISIDDYLQYFLFFTNNLSDCLEIYSDTLPEACDPGIVNKDLSIPLSEDPSPQKALADDLSQVILYLYAFNEYIAQAIEMILEPSIDNLIPIIPYVASLIKSLEVQKKFAYLYKNDLKATLEPLNKDTLGTKAKQRIDDLDKIIRSFESRLV
jgi:hypothetical protein